MVKCKEMVKRIPIKRVPIIFCKGLFVYWVAMSETTALIGQTNIRQGHNSISLMVVTSLISLMIGIVIEAIKEI